MSRSHGQQLSARFAEGPSFTSMVARQAYWERRLEMAAADAEATFVQDVSVLDHQELQDMTQFESANIVSATLQDANPNQGPIEPGNPLAIAGLDASGAIPPPPK